MVLTISSVLALHMESGPAGAATLPSLSFNPASMEVELAIPTPRCPASNPYCEWMLFVNEPEVVGQPIVAEVTGTSGMLEVPYPPDFCGVLQADALVGPGSWAYQTGTRVTINTCTGSTAAATGTVSDPDPASTVAASVATTAATTTAVSAKSTTLPFTGINADPLFLLGTSGLLIGLLLMAERSWLLGYRRFVALRPVRGVAGALAWFVGH